MAELFSLKIRNKLRTSGLTTSFQHFIASLIKCYNARKRNKSQIDWIGIKLSLMDDNMISLIKWSQGVYK